MELKKGMYIRTNKGKIGKIIKQIDNSGSLHHNNYVWLLDNGDVLALHSNKVKNAGFNLIDLIEVEDYVNGEKVTSAEPVDKKDIERYLGFGDYDYYIHNSEDINDIVTKEQFESCKYVIERNNDEK